MKKHRILIIDDDPSFHQQVRYGLRDHFEFEGVKTVEELWNLLSSDSRFDLILLDLVLLPDSDDKSIGLALVKELSEKFSHIPILIVTNRADYQSVVEGIRDGAENYLTKDSYNEEIWNNKFQSIINKDLQKEYPPIKEHIEYINPKKTPLIGVSEKTEHLRRMLKTLADESEMTILIIGETGVGKGVAVRFLHCNSSKRCSHPFEEINVSKYHHHDLHFVLFGALKEAHTDIETVKKGRLHLADNGVVFFDEISEWEKESQILLREFVQTKTIRPLGASIDIELNVQIVAATNKDIRQEVEGGRFREDLYHRLQFVLEIPPLRERRDDIWPLLSHFAKVSESELDTLFEPEIKDFIVSKYRWPGNIRELENLFTMMQTQREVRRLPRINSDCLPNHIVEDFKKSVQLSPPENTSKPRKANTSLKVFISYSHVDEKWKNDLLTHFANMTNQGLIEIWHDRKIMPGDKWDEEIKNALSESDIVLFLISPQFMASNYIREIEIPTAITKRRNGESKIVPIFVHSVEDKNAPFDSLQGLPRDKKYLSKFKNRNDGLSQVAKELRKLIENWD